MDKIKVDIRDVLKRNGLSFEIPAGETFADNLFQSELFNGGYVEKVKEDNINPIIDYEKHIFYPAYLTSSIAPDPDTGDFINDNGIVRIKDSNEERPNLDNYSEDVTQINFNLYFRERDINNNWNVKEESYWNLWDGNYDDENNPSNKALSTKKNGDLLTCLGFDDNDVYYQKNALKKSFIRISIYDSPYRQSQKLLYYSTLFFDEHELYRKYIHINSDNRVGYNGEGIDDSARLTASFSCSSKYNDDASSDGFYLYLFDGVVEKGKCRKLYMKVEFNNAKFGQSVVMSKPRKPNPKNDNGAVVDIGAAIEMYNSKKGEFPTDYQVSYGGKDGNTGGSYVDINKLYGDLYIPIFVRYNNKKSRYEWYIVMPHEEDKTSKSVAGDNTNDNPQKTNGGEFKKNADSGNDIITLNLYEPRLNRLNLG